MRFIVAATIIVFASTAFAEGRYDAFTRRFANTPDQARVVSAGHLGGAGTEWLVGGGFQPDGTVVVAGVSLGPTLDLAGVKAAVLGKDAAAPEAYAPLPQLDGKGQPEKNKDGTPKYKDPHWAHPNATAFVARLSADLKTVKSVVRFPWKTAGLTSAAVDAEGNIYLAGPATDAVVALGGQYTELKAGEGTPEKGPAAQSYLAKLNPAADAILWIRHSKVPCNAPEVSLDAAGKLKFVSADLRTFTKDGKEESATIVPGGLGGRVAVNPKDGTYARGGETRNWNTGREPYRDPILNIFHPTGKLQYELYHWDGPLVGVDNLRLVSDSVVRAVKYDADGNLVIYAWSDGGNSVMYREPFDIRQNAKKFKGLEMSAWGAGVLSCAYIIKIDPKTYRVSGGTLWLAFLQDKDKPNSIWVDTLGFAADGSVLAGGKAAWGLIQTGNKLTDGEPTGAYVAVFNKDFTSLRFSSALPATGKAEIGDATRWGFASSKDKVLVFGSATDKEMQGEKALTAPASGGGRAKFGGGALDGYLMLLDLGAK
jgi:hypothetical protein